MRTLKYAILGLLSQENMSGYDISAQLGGALKEFWTANHSQIYPELKKLTEEGLVEFSVEITGSVLERKVYCLTERGREDFLEWLRKKDTMISTPKDVFRLRMYFSNQLNPEERISLLENELRQHKERLAYLNSVMDKYDEFPLQADPKFGDYLVLMGAVMREETACKWLRKCIALSEQKD